MSFITRFPWLFPTLVFAILVTLGANMHPLWGDEAETALWGRSILAHGVPYGWDGVNIMGINDGVVLDKDLINHTSPWAQYYVVALSLFLFGETSFAARLPFIIISILCIPFFYSTVWRITGDKKTALLSVLILSLSVPFILFGYQARYYALTTFSSIALTYSLFRMTEKSLWPKALFFLSGVLFFYSNYVVFAAFLSALLISYAVLLILQKNLKDLKNCMVTVLGLGVLMVFFTLPWYLIMHPSSGQGQFVLPVLSPEYVITFLLLFYEAYFPFRLNNGLPLLFIVGYLVFLFWLYLKKKTRPEYIFIFFLPFLFLFFMTIFTIISEVITSFVHSRYTMSIFPFLILIVAVILMRLWQWSKWLGALVLVVYLTTNIFSLMTPRSFLWEFVGEVARPYHTPDKVVADYLNQNARAGDTAFVSLDRDHEPLIFHLRDKIRFVNRLTPTNDRVFPENRGIIPRYIYYYLDAPDWIILYSKRGNEQNFLTFDYRGSFPLGLAPGIDLTNNYEEIVLPVFFADVSRPEIEYHSFAEVAPSYDDQVFIYKKKE